LAFCAAAVVCAAAGKRKRGVLEPVSGSIP